MKICYLKHSFSANSQRLLEAADQYFSEYLAQGIQLSLKQLYYILVREEKQEHKRNGYKQLCTLIAKGRMAGIIDWGVDDSNQLIMSYNTKKIIQTFLDTFKTDLWIDQSCVVDVYLENAQLSKQISKVVNPLGCTCFSSHGYMSQTAIWRLAQRYKAIHERGRNPIILFFGNLSPTGMDMVRDLMLRLEAFLGEEVFSLYSPALKQEQVEAHVLLPNAAKINMNDSRSRNYIDTFGQDTWELEAFEPSILHTIIRHSITDFLDMATFDMRKKAQEKEFRDLLLIADAWERINMEKACYR